MSALSGRVAEVSSRPEFTGDDVAAHGPVVLMSETEARFERLRQTLGLFVGPAAFLFVWFFPLAGLSQEAHRLAAIVSLVVVWWVTEAIPIPATALIGTALTVLCGVASAQDAFAPFASPVIFLFIGSFIIGRAISEHQLDRRLALSLLSFPAVRGSVARIRLGRLMFTTGLAERIGLGIVNLTGAESLWTVTAMAVALGILLTEITSNTATTNMLVPVVISMCQAGGLNPIPPALGACVGASMAFMLPISTPPNAIVYGTGFVRITEMLRFGVLLDIVGFFVVFGGLRLLCPLLGFV